MTQLSAAIITYNEEKKLEECLRSISFVDEIVIVDSGSTDGTRAIAERFKARFSTRPFDNFAAQKNEAIRQTRGEWILLIDADERITPELAREIQSILAAADAKNSYELRRLNFFLGRPLRYGAALNDWQLRLIRRGEGLFEGLVHERVRVQSGCGRLKSWMHHHSTQTMEEYFKRFSLYTRLEGEVLGRRGKPRGIEMAVRPLIQFIYFYFFRLGFLDGFTGFQYQILSSFYTFVKYLKAFEHFEKETV